MESAVMEAFYDKTTDNADIIIADSITVNGPFISTVNYGKYTMSGNFTWPDTTPTTCGNWVASSTSGDVLTLSSGTTFTNNLGRTVYVTVCYTGQSTGAAGTTKIWIQTTTGSITWAKSQVTGSAHISNSAVVLLDPGDSFAINGTQLSGGSVFFNAATSMLSVIIQH